MMSKEIEDLLVARATAMAAYDGEPLAHLYALYIEGAANALQSDLLAARDNLLKAPSAEPAIEEAPAAQEPKKGRAKPDALETVAPEAPADEASPEAEAPLA